MENLLDYSVDKVVLVGDDGGGFSDLVNLATFEYLEKYLPYGNRYYKRSWVCRDGSRIDWTDEKNKRAIRVEFNPNNVEKENIIKVLGTMKYGSFNRVDIAFDFNENLSKYTFLDSKSRKKIMYQSGIGELETLYIGANDTPLKVRIYNKAKEQGEDGDWWRVEAQLRDSWIAPLNGDYVDERKQQFNFKPMMPDVFEGLKIFVPEDEFPDLSVQEELYLIALLAKPKKWERLSKPSRQKYKKILASRPTNKEIPIQQIFTEKKSDIMYIIQKWKHEANRRNVNMSITPE